MKFTYLDIMADTYCLYIQPTILYSTVSLYNISLIIYRDLNGVDIKI